MEILWDLQIINGNDINYSLSYSLKLCHPERAVGESKDLGTNFTANVVIMRRFFDSVLRTPLRMTYLVVRSTER